MVFIAGACGGLRQILSIPSAFISRISNHTVYNRAGCVPFSSVLQQKRLMLFGKIMRCTESNLMKTVSFVGDTLRPETDHFVRRIGRRWATKSRMGADDASGSCKACRRILEVKGKSCRPPAVEKNCLWKAVEKLFMETKIFLLICFAHISFEVH
jgi:hypothetical protein